MTRERVAKFCDAALLEKIANIQKIKLKKKNDPFGSMDNGKSTYTEGGLWWDKSDRV